MNNIKARWPLWPMLAVASAIIGAIQLATPVLAQQGEVPPLEGHVVLDGTPVPGVSVSLHHVTSEASGAVETQVTDAEGRFTFPRTAADDATFAFYFVTAQHNSVTFFGPFVRPDEATGDYLVEVYDTATVLPEPVRVIARHMVLVPETSGSWEVNEIIGVLNPTSTALVPGDGSAAWSFDLPDGASDFEVGPGDVLPHELALMEGRVLHLTPVIPGSREIFIRYRLPPDERSAALLVSDPTDTLNIYVRQPSHLTGVEGVQSQRMVDVGEDRFLQYNSVGVAPGSRIELRWARPGPPIDPVWTAVGITVALLVIAAAFAIKNRSAAPARI